LPFNFEELTYVAHVFLPHVIYENVDIVLKVASVNISCNTVPDCITFPIDEAYAPA
jgi:hypothetical protein